MEEHHEHPQPLRRKIASILWFPIFFAIALPVTLGVAFHQPQPDHVPIVVAGTVGQVHLLTGELRAVDAGGFQVHPLPSAAATAAVRDRKVAAAYVERGSAATVYLARAAAPIRANYLQGVFAGIAGLRPLPTWQIGRRVAAVARVGAIGSHVSHCRQPQRPAR
jgi:hypothetical protein